MIKRNQVPKDANPEFKKVMKGVRGKNPDAKRLAEKDAATRKAADKAGKKARSRRKGDHRGDDGVIDTGMFR